MAWANQMQLMLCATAALCRGATGVVLTHGLADTMLANSGDVVIGAEYTAIEGQAFKETAVTSVSFEAGGALISIGAQAFYGCSLLNGALQLPASLETIGVSAFQTKYSEALPNTGGVTSVTFAAADALTSIGDRAFQGSHPADPGCTVYSTNVNNRKCGNNVAATFASTASLADCAAAVDAASECGQHFERNGHRRSGRCSCLGPTSTTCLEVVHGDVDRYIITKSCDTQSPHGGAKGSLGGALDLPASLETIGHKAFINTAVTSLSFAAAGVLTKISPYAFYGCSLLSGVLELPASLETIGDKAFAGVSVTSVVCSRSTSLTIDGGAFDGVNFTAACCAAGQYDTGAPVALASLSECTSCTFDCVPLPGAPPVVSVRSAQQAGYDGAAPLKILGAFKVGDGNTDPDGVRWTVRVRGWRCSSTGGHAGSYGML
jgi:hypothetical protein